MSVRHRHRFLLLVLTSAAIFDPASAGAQSPPAPSPVAGFLRLDVGTTRVVEAWRPTVGGWAGVSLSSAIRVGIGGDRALGSVGEGERSEGLRTRFGYGGAMVELDLGEGRLQGSLGLKVGAASATLHLPEGGPKIDARTYGFVEPGFSAAFALPRGVGVGARLGYRWTFGGGKLSGASARHLSATTVSVAVDLRGSRSP